MNNNLIIGAKSILGLLIFITIALVLYFFGPIITSIISVLLIVFYLLIDTHRRIVTIEKILLDKKNSNN